MYKNIPKKGWISMTKRTTIGKRLLSLLVTLSILMAYLPGMTSAATSTPAPTYSLSADVGTMDGWKTYFGPSVLDTSYSGVVWSDKSVFTGDTNPFPHISISDPQRNFLIALSAIASNKSIVGHSNVPTDTMLVLDISNSMITAGAVDDLVAATNEAITELLKLNNNNRIGVILYSSEDYSAHDMTGDSSTVLLPLDRYTTTNNTYLNHSTQSGGGGGPGGGQTRHYIAVNSNVKHSNGTTANPSSTTNRVEGGTYIQSGLDTAMDQLLAVTDTKITSGFQAGTNRMPVIVLMSDGAPTYASTNIGDIGTDNVGNGSSSSNINTFLTQLTAAYTKAKVKAHYNDTEPLLYTLGLGVGNDENAEAVLDPTTSSSTISGWWNTYVASSANQNGTVAIRRYSGWNNYTDYYVGKVSELSSVSQMLYSNGYFEADTASDLQDAFQAIVQQIIIQSLYYPTLAADGEHHFGGYLSFIDDIGEYFEVASIKGIEVGNVLFTGAELSKNFAENSNGGDLGTTAEPTALGDAFVAAVIERFGFDDADSPYTTYEQQLAAARSLINLAYTNGQLSYTSDTEFSNYIGSYQDYNGNFLSFYNEGTTSIPRDAQGNITAKYKIKSYGMLGTVQDGMKKSDMMYVSISVRTEILPDGSDGDTAVIWQIPASLIPVVSYNITVEGADRMEDITESSVIEVEIDDAEPIQLLYEVALRSDINELNVKDIMTADGVNASNDSVFVNADGTYTFLTNRYDLAGFTANASPSHDRNTVSYFEPSKENERYYYATNATIKVKNPDGSYSNYTGATAPSTTGEYYWEHDVFLHNGTEWVYQGHYDPISAESIALAQRNGDNTWYVPSGTVRRVAAISPTEKADDTLTNTLDYSHYPTIEKSATLYYVDSILGNNGALTLTPATGIRLTKTIDGSLAGTNNEYTFNIVADSTLADGSYEAVHTDANGAPVLEGIESVTFTDGAASVKLKAGESLIILVPVGSYRITEVLGIGHHYTVSKVTVGSTEYTGTATATAVVTNQNLTDVTYLNTYQVNNGYGNLIISKTVTGAALTDPNLASKTFTFQVTLTNSEVSVANKSFDATTGTITTDAQGRFTVTLKAGEDFSIHNLPANTQVSVTETNIPTGFTSVGGVTKTATITNQNTSTIVYTNSYSAASVTTNIHLGGDKLLTGRDWLDGESFQFYLEAFDTTVNNWVAVSGATGTATKTDKTYSIDFRREYTTTGTYYYRVMETDGGKVINGVHYTNAIGYFVVTVTDNLTGQLAASVTPGTGSTATVTPGANANEYNVDIDFTNTYIPEGNATVTVNVQKAISDSSNSSLSLEGFTFGLYAETGTQIGTVTTDSQGKAAFVLTYGPNFVDQTLNYTIREIVPASPTDGMSYNTDPVSVQVKVSDIETTGQITAVVTTSQDSSNNDTETDITVTNTYSPNAATVDFAGLKTLEGRHLHAGEFAFQLFEANSAFITIGNALQTVSNTAIRDRATAGQFNYIFSPLVFDTVNTYYYVIKEAPGTLGGVDYDDTEYHITVKVDPDGDNDGHLDTTVTIEKVVPNTSSVVIVNAVTNVTVFMDLDFVNSYAPSGNVPSVSINVNKEISDLSGSGYAFSKAGYQFGLYLDDACTQAVTDASVNPVIATTDANGIATITVPAVSDPSIQVGSILTYYLKEKSNSVPGMTANTQLYHVHVEVLDNLDGTFGAKVTIHEDGHYTTVDTATYTNVYDPDDVSVTLEGEKTLNGRDMAADEFEFHLYQVADDTFTVPVGAAPLLAAKNAAAANGTASAFRFDPLTFDTVGKYYYVVIEHHSGRTAHGVLHSDAIYNVVIDVVNDPATGKLGYTKTVNGNATQSISFVNTYTSTPAPNNVTVLGEKVLQDRIWLDTDNFQFKVERFAGFEWNDETAADEVVWLQVGTIASATKANGGKFDLTGCLPTEFPEAGTYHYRITEVGGGTTIDGVTYTAEQIHFGVVVKDNGTGALVIEQVKGDTVTGDTATGYTVSAKFTNTYAVNDTVNVPIAGTKEMEGRDLLAKEFQFDLIDSDGRVVESVRNGADGSFTFTKLNYSAPGTHVYTVVENQTVTAERVTNDKTKYQITVTVTDVLDGTLTYSVAVKNLTDTTDTSGKIHFTNVYTPKPTDITVDLGIVKTVKILGDKVIGKDGFQFDLKDGATEEILKTVTTDAEGLASITLTFGEDDIGKHTYKLVEKDTGVEGVTYSNAVYNIEITVALGADNKLTATITCNNQAVDSVSAAFENLYDVDEPAKTGDQMNLMLWLCLLVVSGGLTVTAIRPVVRKKSE